MTTRRQFIGTLTGGLVAEAEQAGKVSRVGFLRFGSTPPAFIEAFRQGLCELGYVEGQDIVIEYGLAHSAGQLPINLTTAKALGLTIPPSVLARVDQVIE